MSTQSPNHSNPPSRPPTQQEMLARANALCPEYPVNAYRYVGEAVHKIADTLSQNPEWKKREPARRHITGRELVEGLREMLRQDFGIMALDVLREWNVAQTKDFGHIVYTLVKVGMLSVSPQDSPIDFENVYSFDEAFDCAAEKGSVSSPLPPNPLL